MTTVLHLRNKTVTVEDTGGERRSSSDSITPELGGVAVFIKSLVIVIG